MSVTPSSAIPPGLPSRPKDFRGQSFNGENHRDIKFLEGYLKDCHIESCIFAESAIIACSVDKCISSGGYVFCSANPMRRAVLRNTTIIDSRIHYADLYDCVVMGCHLVYCTLVNCRVTNTTGSDYDFVIPTEADFSEWDKSLDIFPPEELYLSTDALQIYALNADTVELVDCKIIGSFIENIPIASSKIYSGTTTGCSFYISVLTHVAADKCSLRYSEVRGSRLEECTYVRCSIKACIEDGKVVKYRPSGFSLSPLPAEVRMRIFDYIIGHFSLHDYRRYGYSPPRSQKPNLIKALRGEPILYKEALEVFAKNFLFRLSLPEDLDGNKIPFQWVRQLSLRSKEKVPNLPETQLYPRREDLRSYAFSLPDKNKYPYFPALVDLHMSIDVYGRDQVMEDFQVMICLAKKHHLKRLSITHEENLEHHRRYDVEPPHKAEHRNWIREMIDRITIALEVAPLFKEMDVYEINGHCLPSEPKIYIPKHHWGGSQYTWSWVATEGFLEWKE
ncbi:hypothetical protein HYFRA_00011066 [Hymenoscyphus fraxineus]|uniref:Uncharacterized protein n=1 Tax=Hymenoscyphus fraxineus TaxID=746836 RepID=A0A9N9L3E3_9HELO|nr:hypothetical protein HYFRA_00011066 [Hymenoscyphus fraxineus]